MGQQAYAGASPDWYPTGDDQRDYAEEAYNRTTMHEEAISEQGWPYECEWDTPGCSGGPGCSAYESDKSVQPKIAAGPGTDQAKHVQTYSYSIYMYGYWQLVAVGLTISDIQDIEAKQAAKGRTIANGDFRFNTEF